PPPDGFTGIWATGSSLSRSRWTAPPRRPRPIGSSAPSRRTRPPTTWSSSSTARDTSGHAGLRRPTTAGATPRASSPRPSGAPPRPRGPPPPPSTCIDDRLPPTQFVDGLRPLAPLPRCSTAFGLWPGGRGEPDSGELRALMRVWKVVLLVDLALVLGAA